MKKQTSNVNDDYQLNSLVAMKVMGIKELFYPGVKKQIPYYLPKGSAWGKEVLRSKPLPKYSSEINAAWSVLQKLVSFGMKVHVENSSNSKENGNKEMVWCVNVTVANACSTVVCSESLPDAVCRAALEVMEKRCDV